MQLRPLVDTDGISIAYDQDNDWLYVDWKGIHTQATSQLGCTLMLECLRAHPCSKILNDNSSIIRTEFRITDWGANWLREMREAGLECLAWVYPHNFESRQATEAALLRLPLPMLATFDDLASAFIWLKGYRSASMAGRDSRNEAGAQRGS